MASFLREKLFPIIRTGMDADTGSLGNGMKSVSLSEHDCEVIRKIGIMQDIIPVIWRGLKKYNISDDLIDAFEKDRLKCMYDNATREAAIRNVSAVLDDAGISYVLLKGAAIKKLYPEDWLRSCLDVDILVPEEHIDRAVSVIEEGTDFKMEKRNYHDISMVNPFVHLELHFSIKENTERIDPLLEKVWSYASPSGNGSLYVFTPEYQIFHVIAHMCYHMINGGLGIRPFLDLWLLKNKTEYDESVVEKMCMDSNILKFYIVCCELVEVWMEDAPHNEITAALEKNCIMGGLHGGEEMSSLSKYRKHRGFGYVVRQIFIDRESLSRLYPGLSKRTYLLPVYQIRRWFGFFGRKKRENAKAVLAEMKNSNAEEIDNLDKLLKSMGL